MKIADLLLCWKWMRKNFLLFFLLLNSGLLAQESFSIERRDSLDPVQLEAMRRTMDVGIKNNYTVLIKTVQQKIDDKVDRLDRLNKELIRRKAESKALIKRSENAARHLLSFDLAGMPSFIKDAFEQFQVGEFQAVIDLLPLASLGQLSQNISKNTTVLQPALKALLLGFQLRAEAAFCSADWIGGVQAMDLLIQHLELEEDGMQAQWYLAELYRRLAYEFSPFPLATRTLYLRRHLTISKRYSFGDDLTTARVGYTLSALLVADQQYRLAIAQILQTINLQKRLLPAAKREMGKTYHLLGDTYQQLGQYINAIEAYQKADQVLITPPEEKYDWDKMSNQIALSNISEMLGMAHYVKGEYEKALLYLRMCEADTITNQGDSIYWSGRLRHIATAYQHLGKGEEAMTYFAKSKSITEGLDRRGMQLLRNQYPKLADSLDYDDFRAWQVKNGNMFANDRLMIALMRELSYLPLFCRQKFSIYDGLSERVKMLYQEAVQNDDWWLQDRLIQQGMIAEEANKFDQIDFENYLTGIWVCTTKPGNPDSSIYVYKKSDNAPFSFEYTLRKLQFDTSEGVVLQPDEKLYYGHFSNPGSSLNRYVIRPVNTDRFLLWYLNHYGAGKYSEWTRINEALGTDDEREIVIWCAAKAVKKAAALLDTKRYEEDRIQHQEQLIRQLQLFLSWYPDETSLKVLLAEAYCRLSWEQLLARNFEQAESAAEFGIQQDAASVQAYEQLLLSWIYQGNQRNLEQAKNRFPVFPKKDPILKKMEQLQALGVLLPDLPDLTDIFTER